MTETLKAVLIACPYLGPQVPPCWSHAYDNSHLDKQSPNSGMNQSQDIAYHTFDKHGLLTVSDLSDKLLNMFHMRGSSGVGWAPFQGFYKESRNVVVSNIFS